MPFLFHSRHSLGDLFDEGGRADRGQRR